MCCVLNFDIFKWSSKRARPFPLSFSAFPSTFILPSYTQHSIPKSQLTLCSCKFNNVARGDSPLANIRRIALDPSSDNAKIILNRSLSSRRLFCYIRFLRIDCAATPLLIVACVLRLNGTHFLLLRKNVGIVHGQFI